MATRRESSHRSLAFMVGPREEFPAFAAVLDRAKPGRQWDFVCLYEPEAVPAGARVLRAHRSIGFVFRLWTRACIQRYQSVCIAGQDLDRVGSGWLSTVAASLPSNDHTVVDPEGRTATMAPLGWLDVFSLGATAFLLAVARTVTWVGLRVSPASGPPRPRGRRVAVLVPLLPDLSHTFVYREVLELKRRRPDYLVIALERGGGSVTHREAAELLTLSEPMPKDAPGRYLLRYLGFWARRPRAMARVIRMVAAHTASFGPRRGGDLYAFLRLEHLDNPDYVAAGLMLARHLERRQVGYVHVYGSTFPSVRALVASGLMGVRFSVSTFVDFDYDTPFRMLQEKMSAATFVVACTEYCAASLVRRYAWLADRLAVIRHGLPRGYVSGKTFRARDGRSRLVYVGRFVPKKGLDTLLEACRLLKASGAPFSCHFYGDGPMRAELQRLAAAWRLDDVVAFEGALANEHFYSAMNDDDIFVCASRYEDDGERDGIPVSVMEAMAGGITVVSTSVSGIPELIRDGENGYLVPSNDAAALAEMLKRLIQDPSLRRAVSARAAATVREDFSVERAVDRLEALIARSQ